MVTTLALSSDGVAAQAAMRAFAAVRLAAGIVLARVSARCSEAPSPCLPASEYQT